MIRCRDVHAAYNGTPVLDGVSLSVAPGEWVALIGPNGAGKSTLLRAVTGMKTRGGSIEVGGIDPVSVSRPTLAQTVAFVPQQPVIPEGMTVLDYALLGRNPYIAWWDAESAEDVDIVVGILERVDLSNFAGRRLDQLSGGELQRAILARALAQQTPVLLLDEPTAALDIGHQQQVLDLIDGLRHERGLAVLSAFHDLTLAGQYADRLEMLADGLIVCSGTPDEVLRPDVLERHYQADVRVLDDGDSNLVVSLRRR